MDRAKWKRLQAKGWVEGSAQDFLGLSDDEMRLIDMKIALANSVRPRRVKARLTQAELAKRLGSSQSRVAKIEAGDPEVSMDLLIRAHLALGATDKEVGRIIGKANRAA